MLESKIANINLYVTEEAHNCSYLPHKKASTLYIDPSLKPSVELYTELSKLGFRRSGKYVYRPHCEDCNACIPARVITEDFKANRQQKRTLRNNTDLEVRKIPAQFTQEHYLLYEQYINKRHVDGDMYPATQKQYQDFLATAPDYCLFYEIRLNQKLLAVAVTDELSDGLSAVYTFFDPSEEYSKRSLGQYSILWQMQHCTELGLKYLYLGYYIQECSKMCYKLKYRPVELFANQQWICLN